MTGAAVGLIVAVVANAALIISAIISKRSNATDRAKAGVEILHTVAADLRTELDRRAADNARALVAAANTIKRQDDEIEMLRDELMIARKDTRGSYETAGRYGRRVEYLEGVLREHGIIYDPGPLA